jgi:nitrite reductase/ring-hydroxylating ferredoxin subunit
VSHERRVVCRLADVPDGEARGVALESGDPEVHDAFLVRRGGRVFAWRNWCPHTGGRLDWKPHAFLTRDRSLIMCGTHGAIFEIDTGLCVGGPCARMHLAGLHAAVEGEDVVIYSARSK